MNYEEKYNKALERAREFQKSKDGLCVLTAESIFPELAESEDERIRRTLVEYFGPEVQLDFIRGVPIQKIRDWLEKHSEEEIRKIRKEEYTNGFNDAAGFGKQKEQKSLHWRRIEDATTKRTDDGCCVTSEKMLVKGWMDDEDYRIVDEGTMVNRDILCIPVRDWLEKQKEQKPAEYIKRNSKEWYSLLAEQYDKGFWKGKAEQKPAEWSEEDERMRNALWNLLHLHYAQDNAQTLVGIEAGEFRSWLKSLRPSWKPSEEQMKALHRCIYYLHGEGSEYFEPIKSLYEQLKKLGVKEDTVLFLKGVEEGKRLMMEDAARRK